MTDRLLGVWVAFEKDIRVDDVKPLIAAIKQMKGVLAVKQEDRGRALAGIEEDPMSWPLGICVGHTLGGKKTMLLESPRRELTPDEARAVARELKLRADYQDRTSDTFAGPDGIPHRRCPTCEGRKTVYVHVFDNHGIDQTCGTCGGKGEV